MSVTMNVMLAIHGKRCESVDLVAPARAYVAATFSEREAREAEDDLQSLQSMRSDIIKQSDSLDHRIDLLGKYYRSLSVFETRFPLGKEKGQVNINFQWCDAFKPSKKMAMTSSHYEKAAVLFNLGATFSQMGLGADRSSSDGLKIAYSLFQQAAGAWAYLRDTESAKLPSGSAPVDLTNECASMLERLMLAQAQECVYEKALADRKTSDTVLAKLSWQVGVFYEEAYAMLVLPPLNSHFDKPWLAHLQMKAAQFRAEALYRSSLAFRAEEKIGEEIARLRAAAAIVADARKQSAKNAGAPLADAVAKLETTIARHLERAIKENNSIYLLRVLANDELPAVGASCLVKPTLQTGMFDSSREQLFTTIIPDSSAKALSKYSALLDDMYRTETTAMQRESDEARLRLREWGLPDMLQALEAAPLPSNLQDDLADVDDKGGLPVLHEMNNQIRDLRHVNEDFLQQVYDILEKEAADDTANRQKFGTDKWRRPPSMQLGKGLREKADSFRSTLTQAKASDDRVSRKWKDKEAELASLNTRQMPTLARPMLAVRGDEDQLASSLRQLILELEQTSSQRAGLEERLKEMKDKDDVLPRILAASEQVDTLFKRELAKYDKIKAAIAQNVTQQRDLLAKIGSLQQAFRQAFQVDEWKVATDKVERNMRSAVRSYNELHGHLAEGVRFYTSLQEALSALKQQVADFELTRSMQRDDMVSDLTRQMQQISVGMSPNPPPLQHQNSGSSMGYAPPPQPHAQQPAYNQPLATYSSVPTYAAQPPPPQQPPPQPQYQPQPPPQHQPQQQLPQQQQPNAQPQPQSTYPYMSGYVPPPQPQQQQQGTPHQYAQQSGPPVPSYLAAQQNYSGLQPSPYGQPPAPSPQASAYNYGAAPPQQAHQQQQQHQQPLPAYLAQQQQYSQAQPPPPPAAGYGQPPPPPPPQQQWYR